MPLPRQKVVPTPLKPMTLQKKERYLAWLKPHASIRQREHFFPESDNFTN